MNAGSLDRRITIQEAVETQSASGQTTQTWKDIHSSLPAAFRWEGTKELWKAQQINPLINLVIEIRWIRGITPKMQVKHYDALEKRTRYFGIEGVLPGEKRGVNLFLHCIEDVDG